MFLTGHSIRLEISSSNFPRFDRNPNTGRAFADETTLKKAQQMIYHSRQYPSHVLLPVIPAETEARRRRSGIDFGERRAVWCEEKFRGGSQAPPDSGAVAKW